MAKIIYTCFAYLFSWLERSASFPAREGRSSRPDWLMNVPAGHCEASSLFRREWLTSPSGLSFFISSTCRPNDAKCSNFPITLFHFLIVGELLNLSPTILLSNVPTSRQFAKTPLTRSKALLCPLYITPRFFDRFPFGTSTIKYSPIPNLGA